MRGDDLYDIVAKVQDGDPHVGWRGDPEMDVYEIGVEIGVYGFDAHRQRYLAATVTREDPEWRFRLLCKLRDGDWQRDDTYDRIVQKEYARQDAAERAEAEVRQELSDKFAWGLQRDHGIKRFY